MDKRLFLAIGLAAGLTLAVLVALSGSPAQAAPSCNRYVLNTDGGDSGTCADVNSPCRTVQYALKQAVTGDVICVADSLNQPGPSVYTGTVFIKKSVTLDGAWEGACAGEHPMLCELHPVPCDPSRVVLDAQGHGRVISITGSISPTVHCFTITGGDAAGLGGDPGGTVENDAGGGICSRDAAPVIVSNIITGNYGCNLCPVSYGRGGGVYLLNAPATAVISGNTIANNVADYSTWGEGGGIMLRNSQAQVLHNTIMQNRAGLSAGDGGGIAVKDSSPTIADNQVLTNMAGTGVLCNGGGIFVWSSTPVTIERNLIQLNVALRGTADPAFFSRGGGIYFDGPLALIRDNEVYGNSANLLDQRGLGGGMYLRNLSVAAVVIGNVVANDNRASHVANGNGGGIYLDGCYATVAGNQVFNNLASSETPGYGGGIYVNGGGGLLQGNVITGNLAVLGAVGGTGWGGGIAISNSVVLVQYNRIAENTADSAPNATGVGGGIYVYSGTPQIVGNDVLSNTTGGGGSGFGGGLYLWVSRPWVEGNTILNNKAIGASGGIGGGVRVASCPAFTLTNNVIARNAVSTTGSGIAIVLSTGRIDNNTIAANLTGDGVGVHVSNSSSVDVYNDIIVSHTVGISNATPADSAVAAQYTLFEGNTLNTSAAGVVSANEIPGPAALLADYHIGIGSGAIDRAIPLVWVTDDIDGDPRPIGLPDVGADEWGMRVYLPLVMRNY